MASRTFDVPEGHDAVAVQIDFVPGAAGYVSAGDRINLYGVYPIAVTDRVTPRVELLLTNVAVLDVDTTIAPRRGDRKSVVEGKRVSVRVDPGGRRINKKKKTIK